MVTVKWYSFNTHSLRSLTYNYFGIHGDTLWDTDTRARCVLSYPAPHVLHGFPTECPASMHAHPLLSFSFAILDQIALLLPHAIYIQCMDTDMGLVGLDRTFQMMAGMAQG